MPTKNYFIVHFPGKTATAQGQNSWVKSFIEGRLVLTNNPGEALKFEQRTNATLMKTQLGKVGAPGGIVQSQIMTNEQKRKGVWTFENPKPQEQEETEQSSESVANVESTVETSPSSSLDNGGIAVPEDA